MSSNILAEDFAGKVVLVTGAAVGIGRASSIMFAQRGADVIIVDIDETGLESVAKGIRELGVRVSSYVCDVSDEDRVNET